jgi:hypothetical protein
MSVTVSKEVACVYCNGGNLEAVQGAGITAPAALKRITPVSSIQKLVVPVTPSATGVALIEYPESPDAPHAAGTPVVKEATPFGVKVYV